MKIFILLFALTLVVANPSDWCRDPEDYQKCEARCKFQGFDGWQCEELTGCKCYTPSDDTEEIPDDEINFKCLSNIDQDNCDNLCRRKGFNDYSCDVEDACMCYNQVVPYAFEEIQPIEETFEDIQPLEETFEDILPFDEKIQCYSTRDYIKCRERCKRGGFSDGICNKGTECQCFSPYESNIATKFDIQCLQPQAGNEDICYNHCQTLGMKFGKCQRDGVCSCYNMDVAPLEIDVNPQLKCEPGTQSDMMCHVYCKNFGSNNGKCGVDGTCSCFD